MAMNIVIEFVLDRETSGSVKYREVLPDRTLAQYPNSSGAKIGVLYVRKTTFEAAGLTKFPDSLTVTVET